MFEKLIKEMFGKNLDQMSVLEIVEFITKTYHIPLRKNLKKLDELVELILKDNLEEYPELIHLPEVYNQFKVEVLKHITREDYIVFPAIIRFEKIYNDKLTSIGDDLFVMDKLINDVKMENIHLEFDLYLECAINLLESSNLNGKGNNDFDNAKKIFISIREANIPHSKVENEELYFKGKELQNRLKRDHERLTKKFLEKISNN